ncbi:hypothetical protein LLH03_14500 [bacterium]|nr:hypothetical protein [bacterium]
MRFKRLLPYAIAIVVVGFACSVVTVTKPFAQGEPSAAPPTDAASGAPPEAASGSPSGEPGAGPAQGAAGGGGAGYSWSEATMPEELLMTYGEFLTQEAQAPVPLPEFYLLEDNGTPKKYTRNQWYGLSRIYADQPVKPDVKLVGTPGNSLWNQVYLEAAVKHNEVNAMWSCWQDATTNFWFEVGYPRIGPQLLQYDWTRKAIRNPDGTIRWGRWEATLPDRFTIVVPVVMHVKDRCQQTFGTRFYNRMKPFDNMGDGRSPFKFMTYSGGYYRPNTFYLADEAIQVWAGLWSDLRVQLRLFDPTNTEVVRAAQGSGLSPAIFTQMVHPPVINYQPRYRLLLPHEDDRFKGGRLALEGQEGWYFEFSFTLTRDQLRSVTNAEARLVCMVNGAPTPPQRMKFLAGAAGAAGGAAGAAGAPGAPGAPSGMPGEPGAPGGSAEAPSGSPSEPAPAVAP